MKMLKLIRNIICLSFLAILFSGCGGNGSSSSNPSPTSAGDLTFNTSSVNIAKGGTQSVTLSLINSTTAIIQSVSIVSSDTSIATVNTATCTNLSGTNPCQIIITGVNLGSATITASATNYTPASIHVAVSNDGSAGNLSFNVSSVNMIDGSTKSVILSLNESSNPSRIANVSIVSSNTAAATVSPASCSLSNSTPSDSSCEVIITGSGAGTTAISASATDYTESSFITTVKSMYIPTTQFGVYNNCTTSVWIQAESQPIGDPAVVHLNSGESYDYHTTGISIPSFRVWPKTGCDSNGENCNTGQQKAPCPNSVCQPPIDSSFEATFNSPGAGGVTFYDASLVNGFTFPFLVYVIKAPGENSPACLNADASRISLGGCPTNDDLSTPTSSMTAFGIYKFGPFESYMDNFGTNHILTSVNEQSTYPTTGQVEGCMAPETVLTYTDQVFDGVSFGGLNLGANNNVPAWSATYVDPVIMYACPFTSSQLLNNSIAPSLIQPGESQGFHNLSAFCNNTSGYCDPMNPNGEAANLICNLGPINSTKYVQYIHHNTTNIYAQTYDDTNGNLACNSANTKIVFMLCPAN